MEKADLRCNIKPAYVVQPRNKTFGLEPGTWCVFAAEITDVLDGNPILPNNGLIRVVGCVPSLDRDKEYTLTASYLRNVYGEQYKIIAMNERCAFETEEDKRAFLRCVLTEKQVDKLYDSLDDPFAAVAAHDMKKLCSVSGIRETTAKKILAKYDASVDTGPIYVKLMKFGLTKNAIDRIAEGYGGVSTLLAKVERNPYILIDEADGIGWKKADAIALNAGFGKFSRQRISAFIKYYLNLRAEGGDSWVEVTDVVDAAKREIGIMEEQKAIFRDVINTLNEHKIVWISENRRFVALERVRKLEENIASELKRIYDGKVQKPYKDIETGIKEAEEELGLEYTDEQKDAIRKIIQSNVSILTGFGGTGKTTVVAGVLKILDGYSYAQTALSGRAAARMSEVTSKDGYTIHRLLGYKPDVGFTHNKDNPLHQQIIILDEVSMVGADLFYRLIQAIETGHRIIMIGDDGQLESIGMCNVFKDMLKSGYITVARLTKIHRQAAKSAIITESIKVRNAIQLTTYNWVGNEVRGELKDLELDIYRDGKESFDHIISHFKSLYENNGHDCTNIQAVLPQRYRGGIATLRVNTAIQEIVNPANGQEEIKINYTNSGNNAFYTLRVNDLVIVNKNNYDTKTVDGYECPVYNGNRGRIKSIDKHGDGRIVVDFEQWGEVVLPRFIRSTNVWNTIELAYALTCHKLQGSEAKYVIVGIDNSAHIMLTREWLYTAITRAKKYCVLCAEAEALDYSIKTSNVPFKQTFLKGFIKKYFEEPI